MKTVFGFVLGITLFGGFGGGTALYMAGRIILPELHLPVPAYGAFFWACFWVTLFSVALHFVIELFGDS